MRRGQGPDPARQAIGSRHVSVLKLRRFCRLAGLLCLLFSLANSPAHAAWASAVTILSDSSIPQYLEAQAAAKQLLPDAQQLDVKASDLKQQLERAAAASGVILAIGHKALLAAQSSGAIVVFCMVLGPSVNNAKTVTGLRLEVAPVLQFSFIKRVHPGARRLGVIYDARTWGTYAQEAIQVAAAQGLTLLPRQVSDAREVRIALSDLAGNIDGLWLIPDPSLISIDIFNFLLVSTLERKLALFGFFADFTRRGALASVAPDYAAIGRQAAQMAAALAEKPPTARYPLPPSVASPGGLTINAKTARQLGLDLSEEIQNAAKQVYR